MFLTVQITYWNKRMIDLNKIYNENYLNTMTRMVGHYIGSEVNRDYCAIAQQRLLDLQQELEQCQMKLDI